MRAPANRLCRVLLELALLACLGGGVAVLGRSATAHAAGRTFSARPVWVHPQLWPSISSGVARDPRIERKVDHLLAEMTLEQEVGQLIDGDISTLTPQDLHRYPLGAVLNGGNSKPGGNTLAPPSAWLALANQLYLASMATSDGPHAIPEFWGIDAVHGNADVYGATVFPQNVGLGAAHDPELIRLIGEATAEEVRAIGLDWAFAPTLAVVSDDRWGRSYESYSQDPAIVREYSRAMVLGLQGAPGTRSFLDAHHVLATPKHYVGDGGTHGVDQGDNTESETELRDRDAAGYPIAIEAGAQTVMVSFSSWRGVKMAANYGLLTEVLKGRWHFDGFTVGDWNAHGEVPGCTDASCPQAIDAGLDMLMAPTDWKQLYANTLEQVRSGRIPRSRLDDAVKRILRVKVRDHLFEEGPPASRPLAGHFDLLGSVRHRAIARRAVRESLVLLKNEDHLLPLSPHVRVLVAGDGADNIPKQCGGWSITWQGTGTTNAAFPHGESIWQGIRQVVHAAGGTAELSPDGTFKRKPDVAIVVYGESPYAEFQGDAPNLAFSAGNDSDGALLERLHADGIPVVSVFISGRPLWVNPELNASNAFVAAWLPGSEGGGIADVLFRKSDGTIDHDFSGKLPFSWPRTPLQFGTDTPGKPLFPLGYGLRDASNGNLPRLPEDGGLSSGGASNVNVFFASGRPGDGWHWVAADDVTPVDELRQEDARALHFKGQGPTLVGLAGGSSIDLSRQTNGQLSLGFDYRVDEAPSEPVTVAMGCGVGCTGAIAFDRELERPPPGQWRHLNIPLACFARAGADMHHISMPFAVETRGKLVLSVGNIRLQSGTAGLMSCAQ